MKKSIRKRRKRKKK